MSGESIERIPLVGNDDQQRNTMINYDFDPSDTNEEFQGKAYKRRWWILFVFFACGWIQGVGYVSLPAINGSIQVAYGWSILSIAMTTASLSLTVILLGIPIMYVAQKGLRVVMLIASASVSLGGISWVIAVHTHIYWLLIVGSIGFGVAGTVIIAGAALLSVTWFPLSQRTLATAIAFGCSAFGIATGAIIAPQFMSHSVTKFDIAHPQNLSSELITSMQTGIKHLTYFDAGYGIVVFLMVLIYFPSTPPQPCCKSRTAIRYDFLAGLKKLLRNVQYLLVALVLALTNGIFVAWIPLLAVGFRSFGVGEDEAGWIVFTSMTIGYLLSIPVSLLTDKFKRKSKTILKVLIVTLTLSVLVVACVQERYIPISEKSIITVLYILCIVIASAAICSTPLIMELACDYAYPVDEGLAGAVMMTLYFVAIFVFFALFLLPNFSADISWMNWTYFASCSVSIPVLFTLKDDYSRLEMDE